MTDYSVKFTGDDIIGHWNTFIKYSTLKSWDPQIPNSQFKHKSCYTCIHLRNCSHLLKKHLFTLSVKFVLSVLYVYQYSVFTVSSIPCCINSYTGRHLHIKLHEWWRNRITISLSAFTISLKPTPITHLSEPLVSHTWATINLAITLPPSEIIVTFFLWIKKKVLVFEFFLLISHIYEWESVRVS